METLETYTGDSAQTFREKQLRRIFFNIPDRNRPARSRHDRQQQRLTGANSGYGKHQPPATRAVVGPEARTNSEETDKQSVRFLRSGDGTKLENTDEWLDPLKHAGSHFTSAHAPT